MTRRWWDRIHGTIELMRQFSESAVVGASDVGLGNDSTVSHHHLVTNDSSHAQDRFLDTVMILMVSSNRPENSRCRSEQVLAANHCLMTRRVI